MTLQWKRPNLVPTTFFTDLRQVRSCCRHRVDSWRSSTRCRRTWRRRTRRWGSPTRTRSSPLLARDKKIPILGRPKKPGDKISGLNPSSIYRAAYECSWLIDTANMHFDVIHVRLDHHPLLLLITFSRIETRRSIPIKACFERRQNACFRSQLIIYMVIIKLWYEWSSFCL